MSERKCSEAGCEALAENVKGYYLVGARRVRVWVCATHYVMTVENPLQLLPTPRSIQIALEEEQAERRIAEYRHRVKVVDRDARSVKALASSGHGEPVRHSRVESWRWDGFRPVFL